MAFSVDPVFYVDRPGTGIGAARLIGFCAGGEPGDWLRGGVRLGTGRPRTKRSVLMRQSPIKPTSTLARIGVTAVGALLALSGLTGCEVDSYMDPSVIGRFDRTPTSVPILERLAAIEDVSAGEAEYTDPTDADLVPVAKLYRLAAGDRLEVEIYDVIEPGRPEKYERQVDTRGMIELPQFGQIAVGGLTVEEATNSIKQVVARLVPDPLVSLNPLSQRQQTFTLIGAVQQPGPYYIPSADYRLLEALTAGGTFDNGATWVYVIRQIQLTGEEAGLREPGTHRPEKKIEKQRPQENKDSGERLIDVIDDITKPADKDGAPKSNPGMLAQPAAGNQPAVDMDAPERRPAPPTGPTTPGGQWVFLNGRWIQVSQGAADLTLEPGATPILTQRIIRVSMKDLTSGERAANIVVRPGDIVRIPAPPRGVFYVGGQISRPGIFTFPEEGRMTLLRAIFAGGGLSATAIPERIDLIRMVAPDRQATIRLNGRAIAEQTHPDIFIKSDDVINIGTNFWALPLAVIRNGFRASYGFGFLLDRNFDEEVFGLRESQRLRIP